MHNKIPTLTIILTITSVVFMIHNYDSAVACTCVTRTPTDEFNVSSAVFAGKVIGHDPSGHGYKVTFEVDRSWKGTSGERAIVYTGLGGGDCGYSFKIGEKYLVYTYNPAEHPSTGICNRTQPLGNAQEDLNALGEEWKVYWADSYEDVFKIPYRLSDGNLRGIEVDPDFTSIIVAIESPADGTVEITIPRNLIDAKFDAGGGDDDEFIVLVDGEEETYEETNKSRCFRTLLIPFPRGAEEIEVIATTVYGGSPSIVPPVYVNVISNIREIQISGCTNLALDDKEVFLEVEGVNPEGEIYQSISLVPNRDGSFSISFFIPDAEENYNASFTVKATYADYTYTYVPEFPVNLMIIAAIGLISSLIVLRLNGASKQIKEFRR